MGDRLLAHDDEQAADGGLHVGLPDVTDTAG
jgi:hypothetical protein